jgi:hypothetical protein
MVCGAAIQPPLASAVHTSMRFLPALPLFALAACSTPAPPAAPPPVAPAAPPTVAPAPPSAPATPPSAPTASPSASATPAASEPPPLKVTFHRELEAAVTAIAIERAPFAAAVTRESVWMHEARGWHEEKLPAAARGVPFAVFYGRDDRVRLVSVRAGDVTPPGIYLRWKPNGFRAAPYELGKLAAMPKPLVSVLGNDDPEIVCQPGEICVEKRRTGWRWLESPADIVQVALGKGVGWAVAGNQLLRLGPHWEKVGPPGEWRAADALFATRDRAWVVETAAGRVHAFDGARWIAVPSPIERPRALWGARDDALWLAGEGGLAFFDGKVWRRVADAPAPLAAVAGRGAGEVWIGGERGLFRIEPPR